MGFGLSADGHRLNTVFLADLTARKAKITKRELDRMTGLAGGDNAMFPGEFGRFHGQAIGKSAIRQVGKPAVRSAMVK